MTTKDDPFSAEALKLPDELIRTKRVTSRRVRKRRECFVMFPMRWSEVLAEANAAGKVYSLAIYLLHLDWRNKHQPFLLPNGKLVEAGVSRWSKYRSLKQLEGLGLVSVEYRERKSPFIRVHL